MARLRKSPVNDASFLEAALEGLQLQKARIEEQIQEVRRLLGSKSGRSTKSDASARAEEPAKKRELSPAARKRIAAAQKRRWAEYRKTKPKSE